MREFFRRGSAPNKKNPSLGENSHRSMTTPGEMSIVAASDSDGERSPPSLLPDQRKSAEIGDGTSESTLWISKWHRAEDAGDSTVVALGSGSEIGEKKCLSSPPPVEGKHAEISEYVDHPLALGKQKREEGSEIGEKSPPPPEKEKVSEMSTDVDQSPGNQKVEEVDDETRRQWEELSKFTPCKLQFGW